MISYMKLLYMHQPALGSKAVRTSLGVYYKDFLYISCTYKIDQ